MGYCPAPGLLFFQRNWCGHLTDGGGVCQRLCYVFFVARRKPQNPLNDISKLVGGWLGGSGPGTNPTAARVQSQVKEAAKAADAALGGFGQAVVNDARRLSSGSGYVPSETIKAAAVNTAAAAAGYGAAKVAGKAASQVSRAYKTAKETAESSRVVLYHGGPAELKGGVIDPSFVRGNTASNQMSGNVAALNQQSLAMVPHRQFQLEQNAKFMQDRLNMPGYYAAEDVAEIKARINKSRRSSADLGAWADKAKKGNYFTGVGSANDTYWHSGSVHVVNPRRADVQTGLGPGGEYQIVGKQKPVASFPTGGRPGKQADEAIRLAQQAGDALAKKQRRQAVIKQTAKNLRPKKR
jgi:hypothetical protein